MIDDLFLGAAFGVENAVGMYAYSYAVLPPEVIYELEEYDDYLNGVPSRSHIYFIGETPRVVMRSVARAGNTLLVVMDIGGTEATGTLEMPTGSALHMDEQYYYIIDKDGRKTAPSTEQLIACTGHPLPFKVLYIGQAYGTDGSRTAADRLLKHEKLQEIAIRGPSEGCQLSILMVELASNQLITQLNPFADEQDEKISDDRISKGLDQLFGMSMAERVSLYEAAMIRYFLPKYNIEFKKSFPSTNLKILNGVYDKDFSAVIAEYVMDESCIQLFSDNVEMTDAHIAHFDLHKTRDRHFFFSSNQQP